MGNPTNTRSSIIVFLLIVSFGLFAIIYTFNNENWVISNNIHIRSIMVIIAMVILSIVKLVLLIKEYRKTKGKDYSEYIIYPNSFAIVFLVMNLYIIVIGLNVFWIVMGIITSLFCLLYLFSYYQLKRVMNKIKSMDINKKTMNYKKFMIFNAFSLLILGCIWSVYLFLNYDFIPYSVPTDLGSFYIIATLGCMIYNLDFMFENMALSVIKVEKGSGMNTYNF